MTALAAALCLGAAAHGQKRPKTAAPPATLGAKIDSFKDIMWRPSDNYFQSPGPVRITLTGRDPADTVVLNADDAEGTPEGEITVKGKLSLQRSDALLTGTALRLNATTLTGSLSKAEAHVGMMKLRGADITMAAGHTFVAHRARFTTCPREDPHFCITATDLKLNANGKVVARNVALELDGRRVLVVPTLEKTFASKVENPFPLPTYSKETGPKVRLANELISSPRTAMDFDVVASLKRAPFGSLSYELDLGRPAPEVAAPSVRSNAISDPVPDALEVFPEGKEPPIGYTNHPTVLFATLGANEYVYHRVRTDIRVSRAPEIGLVAYRGALIRPKEDHGSDVRVRMDRPAVYGQIIGGYYREKPTDASESRALLRMGAVGPALHFAPSLSLRSGVDVQGSAYTDGSTYGIVAPQAEIIWRLASGTALAAGYTYRTSTGETPFLFDKLDVRKEVRLRYEGDYARWGLSLLVAYDADRWRAYDTSVGVLHRLDCMEFGLTYRTRSQGLGVVLNLLPPPPAPANEKEKESQ